jgi:quercetin dioxygenase-like cupin family protein
VLKFAFLYFRHSLKNTGGFNMIVSNEKNVDGKKVNMAGAKDVEMKVLVSPKEGWDGYIMRIFEIDENGHTPRHKHPWPHINYIISGRGILHYSGEDHEIEEGGFAYLHAGVEHQFLNTGKGKLRLICIVPEEGHK